MIPGTPGGYPGKVKPLGSNLHVWHRDKNSLFLRTWLSQKWCCVSIAVLIQDIVWFNYPAFIGKGALAHQSETHRLSTWITGKFGVSSQIGTQIQGIPREGKSNIIGARSRWVETVNRSHHRLSNFEGTLIYLFCKIKGAHQSPCIYVKKDPTNLQNFSSSTKIFYLSSVNDCYRTQRKLKSISNIIQNVVIGRSLFG